MARTVYLYQDHENFQVGKTPLKRGSVFETNFMWITVGLLITLFLLAVGGNSLRLQWRYEQTGKETTGTVTGCSEVRGSKSGVTTYVNYQYTVYERNYSERDTVGSGRLCNRYPNGNDFPVYYLSDAPQESGIGAFLHQYDWNQSYMFGSFGIGGIIFTFYLILKNRMEQYKHALLHHADTILDANVIKVGYVKGKHGYHYADYVFRTPAHRDIYGQVRTGKQYPYPSNIARHDTLKILYYNDETYCVL